MDVAFLGTPAFAVPTLERLAASGFQVKAVFTQPDRPKGRGQEIAFSPVKQCALGLGLPVYQPERIRRPENVEFLRALNPRAMVVVGYGQIIPQSIIDIPELGIINVHASLLPKYRGAAPIQWAIANEETVTGVTTMRINAGLDTGDMLLKAETPIGVDETAIELSAWLAETGADLLIETMRGLDSGSISAVPQNHAEATLAPILTKDDGRIDWAWPAGKVHARVRGFQPWPGAYTQFRGQTLQIWKSALAQPRGGRPGSLDAERNRLFANCGDNSTLELLEVQLPGKKRMPAVAFLNGHRPTQEEQLQ